MATDELSHYGSKGCGFDSCWAHHSISLTGRPELDVSVYQGTIFGSPSFSGKSLGGRRNGIFTVMSLFLITSS